MTSRGQTLQRYSCVLLAALLILLTSIATSESSSFAGPAPPVDAAFFGMHVHRATTGTAWPPVSFADWRLWDSGVAWPQLEPARGQWDFTQLDRYTQIAKDHHVEILLTLGLTPSWASSRPQEHSAYSNGNAAEPQRPAAWEEYVRTVATRYKGIIHSYEIWNEPSEKGTFTGNVDTMVGLSRSAYRVLKSVDPTITVVSPSATTDSGLPWLNEFLRLGGCQSADVIGYHFYVTPGPPERMISLIQAVQALMRKHGCQKPLWNTESGWAKPKQFTSDEETAAYLMRSYLLNWLLGVQRLYWYAWDNHNWSTLDLTSATDHQMTNAGRSFEIIRGWMMGAVLRSCNRERSGVWTCQLERGTSISRIAWSDSGQQAFSLPSSWQTQHIANWRGELRPAAAAIDLGPAPTLLQGPYHP